MGNPDPLLRIQPTKPSPIQIGVSIYEPADLSTHQSKSAPSYPTRELVSYQSSDITMYVSINLPSFRWAVYPHLLPPARTIYAPIRISPKQAIDLPIPIDMGAYA